LTLPRKVSLSALWKTSPIKFNTLSNGLETILRAPLHRLQANSLVSLRIEQLFSRSSKSSIVKIQLLSEVSLNHLKNSTVLIPRSHMAFACN
jgi:hypothetical protein